MSKRLTTEEFIQKAKEIHGDTYDYSKVSYQNNKTPVEIICKKHGVFEMRSDMHLHQKQGCPKCAKNSKKTTDQWLDRFKEVHGDEYDYSLIETIENTQQRIPIICPKHGKFTQRVTVHYHHKNGCPSCGGTKKLTTETFIKKAKKIHGDRYDYSNVDYMNNKIAVRIICKEHGEFKQRGDFHLRGCGCPKCTKHYTTEEFIEECKKIHGDRYDYSKTKYKGCNENISIICKKHGLFKQDARNHKRGFGCQKCRASLGERAIALFLNENGIDFIEQKTFEGLVGTGGRSLRYDFFIPHKNILIEFDGRQHFEPLDAFGGEETLELVKEHDSIKNEFAKQNQIKLVRIFFNEIRKINRILSKELLVDE